MLKEIFINVSAGSTRIAIAENKEIVELYLEMPDHQRMVGNIYKGKIQNVLPGMQAAFIDIGVGNNAFLPFSEIGQTEFLENSSFHDENTKNKNKSPKVKRNTTKSDFGKLLKVGEDILVQIIKEPYGDKGPRVTTDVSIPGSLLVLVPNGNYLGISRKIGDKYEKRRLRRIIKELKPDGVGLILRTIAEGKDKEILTQDYRKVLDNYNKMNHRVKNNSSPTMVYEDFETVDQVIRDLCTSDINRIMIDNKPLYKRLYNFIKTISPDFTNRVYYFKNKGSIFDIYDIESQIDKFLKRKVWLKSGAYLIIEQTEAMLVIDVNSGRFIGKKDHEQNSMAINREAAKEISRQLRLRDSGGLIVIDFIDLLQAENRKRVFEEFKQLLKKDRARVSVSEFSNFGLLEMTRQRIRVSLLETISEECSSCRGIGRISSKDTVLTSIENWIKRFKKKASDKRLVLHIHPSLSEYISKNKPKILSGWRWSNWIYIEIEENSQLIPDEFKIFSKKRKKFVTELV